EGTVERLGLTPDHTGVIGQDRYSLLHGGAVALAEHLYLQPLGSLGLPEVELRGLSVLAGDRGKCRGSIIAATGLFLPRSVTRGLGGAFGAAGGGVATGSGIAARGAASGNQGDAGHGRHRGGAESGSVHVCGSFSRRSLWAAGHRPGPQSGHQGRARGPTHTRAAPLGGNGAALVSS